MTTKPFIIKSNLGIGTSSVSTGAKLIVTGGNVGIGSVTPASRLSVAGGNIQLSGTNAAGAYGILFTDGTFLNTAPSNTLYQSKAFSYTGDGTTTTYSTSPYSFSSLDNTMVYINGVYQRKSTYSWSETTLTFSSAPPLYSLIELNIVSAASSQITETQTSLLLNGSTVSTDYTNGALVIQTGGAGIAGNLNVNGSHNYFTGIVGVGTTTVTGIGSGNVLAVFGNSQFSSNVFASGFTGIHYGSWSGANIPLSNGGTNASLTASNGGIVYSTASALAVLAASPTVGNILVSGGAGVPIWGPSYSTANGAGNIVVRDNTGSINASSATLTGQINASAVTSSISTTTGAIITAGGVGIAGNLNAGGSHTLFFGNVGIGTSTVTGLSATSELSVFGGNIQIGSANTGIVFANGTFINGAPSGAVVGTTDTQTLTNKRINPRVSSTSSITSPLAWNSDNFDQYCATAQAGDLTINADAGTPVDGQKMLFRFKDNGTIRNLSWTTGTSKSFRAIGVTLPAATVANKTVYIGCVYNTTDSRWDVVAVAQEA